MKDCLGNKLALGQRLFWHGHNMVCTVLKIDEPALTDAPPTLTVAVEIEGMAPQQGRARGEAQMASFMRIVDPSQEEKLNKLMGGSVQ
jgi:hypothetical protein